MSLPTYDGSDFLTINLHFENGPPENDDKIYCRTIPRPFEEGSNVRVVTHSGATRVGTITYVDDKPVLDYIMRGEQKRYDILPGWDRVISMDGVYIPEYEFYTREN